jgi:DNA-binding HxlR family transcriptional regulator
MGMEVMLSTIGEHTRLRMLQELDRRRNITWGGFKTILSIKNDRHLANHLNRLAKAGLIRKSPLVRGYELTEQGSKLVTLIASFKSSARKEVGRLIKVIIVGRIEEVDLRALQEKLNSVKPLEPVLNTSEKIVYKFADSNSDVRLELGAKGNFFAEASIPMTSVLTITSAGTLRDADEQFLHFLALHPTEAKPRTRLPVVGSIPSWILMANSLIWCLMYFLFNALPTPRKESQLQFERYDVTME